MNKYILFVGNHQKTGNRNIWQDLAEKIEKYFDQKVICTSNKNIRILKLLDMIFTIIKNRKLIKVGEVDLFSDRAFTWGYLSGKLLKKLNIPFIIVLHGGNLPQFAIRNPKQVESILRDANVVVAPSKYLYEKLCHYRKDIVIIPNAIDTHLYQYKKEKKNPKKIVWLRSFHQIYNPIMAITVISLIKKDGFDISFRMVGPDKRDGSKIDVINEITKQNLETVITIIDGIPKLQVGFELSAADIFLNTTNIDNTPVSVIEAMACGLCIISTNVGGIPYLLQNDEDALLVPPNNPEAMAVAVERILTEPDLAEKLSRNARKKAESFDWSIILPKWIELFESVANQHRA
jgi:glycosyltransferase involved in cell wall biosynthesis